MKVHVSSLNSHEFCPRIVYLKDVLNLEPKPDIERSKGLVGHAIRKELSLRQSKLLGRIEKVSELGEEAASELDAVLKDVPHTYMQMLDGIDTTEYVSEIKSQLEGEIRLMADRMTAMVDELGIERSLELVTPWRVEYTINSKELSFRAE